MSRPLVIANGRVWTGDRARPWAEALAIDGDRIRAVGSLHEVRTATPDRRELDAGGGLVTPGFIDAHIHVVAGGFRLASVQLRHTSSRDQLAASLQSFAATRPPGAWITGGDWDHQRWGGVLPERSWIDAATPAHPVWITRLDGHMGLANSAALRLAGVDTRTLDVAGGEIVRDASGAPTGLLKDNATLLVTRVIPAASPRDEDAALDAAMHYLSRCGVTSAHHMGSIPPGQSWEELAIFDRARDAGRLRVRLRTTVPLESWRELRDLIASGARGGDDGRGDEWLRIGALKTFVDGSLGSHTAAFHAPYDDAPGCGLLVNDIGELRRWIRDADAAGLQISAHAIGDRANTLILDLFEEITRLNGPRDRRLRVEHAQHLRPDDIHRFSAAGVIASMQPYHAVDDGRWAERAIGLTRARTSFAWRSLADAGARLAFGSDWFVAPPVVVAGLAAAVTRQTLDGGHPHAWIPEQRLSLEQALRAYTVDAAFAAFDEKRLGQLVPGHLADVAVLDRDLFAVSPETLTEARVVVTVTGGALRVHD